MAILKCPCPSCHLPLQIVKALPAQVTCPRCGVRFTVAGDGLAVRTAEPAAATSEELLVALETVPPAQAGQAGRRVPLAVRGGGLVALLAVAIGVVLFHQSRPPEGPGAAAPEATTASLAALKEPPSAGAQPASVKKARPPGQTVAARAKGIFAPAWVSAAQIKRTIDRGVTSLKASLVRPGPADKHAGSPGAQALAGLALLACGVPADDKVVADAARRLRAAAPHLRKTYDLALSACFLDRLAGNDDPLLVRTIGLQLIAGQKRGGGWDYVCEPLAAAQQEQLLALLQRPWDVPAAAGVLTQRADLPVFAFQRGQVLAMPLDGHEDNSLTQFALLALWAAGKHGVPVERSLAFAAARFRSSQNADGSWGYTWGLRNRTDSMTCAGLFGLAGEFRTTSGAAPAKAWAGQRDLAADPRIAEALRFLGRRIGRSHPLAVGRPSAEAIADLEKRLQQADAKQRKLIRQWWNQQVYQAPAARGRLLGADTWGDLYYLWSLARVGRVYGLDTIGSKPWHAWGTGVLVRSQNPEGGWSDAFPGMVDTSFALLFLSRADLVPELTAVLRALGKARDPGLLPEEAVPPALTGGFKPGLANGGEVKAWSPPPVVR